MTQRGNRLQYESSPYLLQHAHNPVDWWPWGADAFQTARAQAKPIFLSIGYATCYWCHVMERQCFESDAIAALMNEHYINIKVDREERPDVDDIYMTAVQAMTGRGGWPMSVFLTPPGTQSEDDPGLIPFYAGTYFPPTPMQNMPSFPQVLQHLATAWREQRPHVIQQAQRIAQAVKQNLTQRDSGGELSQELIDQTVRQLLANYDAQHGGFGAAPKFPQPNSLLYLIHAYQSRTDDTLWNIIRHTLDRMARGGMYDQVGGGFHRYSVDEKWLVPHFEKMLYDNAQLIHAYLAAHQTRPHEPDADFDARIVRQICDYVLREMLDETATFWSAQDAEVDAREGGNYVWTTAQVREALQPLHDETLTELALTMYGLNEGPNFQDPHHPDDPPVNVLYLPMPLHELAAQRSMSLPKLLQAKHHIDAQLYAVRMKRKQPTTDDKVLASWNGMMIAALARAGRVLNVPTYVDAASRAARYILQHMRDAQGGLLRTMRRGQAKIPAFLEDYAFFTHALIELHRAQPRDSTWRDAAEQLMHAARQRFAAEQGGYFDTLADQRDLFVRTRAFHDGAIPSGNSQMIHNRLDLYELAGPANGQHHLDAALADLRSFAGTMRTYGPAMTHMHHALLRAIELAPTRLNGDIPTVPHDAEDQIVTVQLAPSPIDLQRPEQTLRITLHIKQGHHLNSHNPTSEYLTPTQVWLHDGGGFELAVTYPTGKWEEFTHTDEPVSIYEGTVQLQAVLRRVGQPQPDAAPQLMLRYQPCTTQACLPPQQVQIPLASLPRT